MSKIRSRLQITLPFYSAGTGAAGITTCSGTSRLSRAPPRRVRNCRYTSAATRIFLRREGKAEQLRWFDYWLKGIDTGIMREPSVKLCVRTRRATAPGASEVSLRVLRHATAKSGSGPGRYVPDVRPCIGR